MRNTGNHTKVRGAILLALLAPLLASGLTGCAYLFPHHSRLNVQPVALAAPDKDSLSDDGAYADAMAAINHRDYALALEALQTARARVAADVRVLNAFGVVYDELGRFDLSARYYQQAQALDPRSSIVANNLSFSLVLQARQAEQVRLADAATVPRAPPVAAPASAATLYAQAVEAISRDDNARALDLLAEARTRNGADVRVLNALGVVYDRMGRFDLSRRYYGQAAALDPGSTIVADNLASSRRLQAGARAAATGSQRPATPEASTIVVARAAPDSCLARLTHATS